MYNIQLGHYYVWITPQARKLICLNQNVSSSSHRQRNSVLQGNRELILIPPFTYIRISLKLLYRMLLQLTLKSVIEKINVPKKVFFIYLSANTDRSHEACITNLKTLMSTNHLYTYSSKCIVQYVITTYFYHCLCQRLFGRLWQF